MINKKESLEFIKRLEKCNKLYEEFIKTLDEAQRKKLSELDIADFVSDIM